MKSERKKGQGEPDFKVKDICLAEWGAMIRFRRDARFNGDSQNAPETKPLRASDHGSYA
jgi:hypothetical protein